MDFSPAVIFLDVDGTIIDANGTVPESAVKAIKLAQNNGHICVINTGRPFSHIVDSVRALGAHGYICACGQYIAIDGRIIKDEVFTVEESQAMIKSAKKYRSDLFIESEAGLFYSFVHPISDRMNREFDRFRARGFDVDADVENDEFYFSKFCAWESDDTEMQAFLDDINKYVYPIRQEGRMYEMVKNGCSKARGIKSFLDALGLQNAVTYAVGDSGNDLEMLSCVEHSVAMAHAPESLKKQAEFVTTGLYEDGLYNAFLHFGLI